MANQAIYPYGTGGQLPSSIGVINDLITGGADKALSAEMGKELNEKKADAELITTSDFQLIEDAVFIPKAWISTDGKIVSHNVYGLVAIPYKAEGNGIYASGFVTNDIRFGYFTEKPEIGSTTTYLDAPTRTNNLVTCPYDFDGWIVFHIWKGTLRAFDGKGIFIASNSNGVTMPTSTSYASLIGNCVTKETMAQGEILPKLAGLLSTPKNLLNPEDILAKKYIQASTGEVVSYSGSSDAYVLAVVRNIKINEPYVFSSNVKLSDMSYNLNGVSIYAKGVSIAAFCSANFSTRHGYPFVFEPIDNNGYMGFKISGESEVPCDIYFYVGQKGYTAKLQFERGSEPTEYEEYGKSSVGTDWSPVISQLQSRIASLQSQISDVKAVPSRFAGCNYVAFGDSITDENYEPSTKYTSFINDALSCTTYTNYGRSGATASTANTNNSLTQHVRAVNLTNYDLATIMIGVNDKGYNVPLGTISSTDTSTFYGAMNDIITYMINANKNMRIVLLTPFNTSSSSANTQNLNVVDYADAIKEIGKKYSIPVIDCYGESGVCPLNWSTYTSDNLHLNATGHQWVADYIVAQLKNL